MTHAFTTPTWTDETGRERRLVVYYDDDYRTRGSYCLETEEETRAAEDYEIAMLESYEWSVYGHEEEIRCPCCGDWGYLAKHEEETFGACWGYVGPWTPEGFAAAILSGDV